MQKHLRSFSFLIFIFLISSFQTNAQYFNLNNDLNNQIEGRVSQKQQRFHSEVKPYQKREIDSIFNSDSVLYQGIDSKFTRTWAGRKLFNENLLQLRKKGYTLTLDPVFDFEVGRDLKGNRNVWVNTRGVSFSGTIGTQFSFETRIFENQATFIYPVDSLIRRIGVVPGQGTYKGFKTDGFDYFMSEANISYSPSRYFNFQLGQGKNFIGDGYRSLLLSDASFSYPYLKVTADVWVLKYTCTYAQFQDIRVHPNAGSGGDQIHTQKYGVFHYLSAAITPKFTLGFFESVIWSSPDSANTRGFEFSYLNPIIFLRPIEEANGSSDNALMGMNSSFKIMPELTIYTQLMLDEFKLEHIKNQDGWAGNKFGFQLGAKGYNVFDVKGLSYRAEFNTVRPYTYSHSSSIRNYGHFNQPLAHPQGSNFNELVTMITYNPNRWTLAAKLVATTYGADTNNLNFGGDIYKSYTTAYQEYNNKTTQGLKTNFINCELRCNYMLNPRNRMMLEGIVSYRHLKNDNLNQSSLYFGIAFKTSVLNLYYDFQ
jgi:hypothetical protein